MHVGRGGDRSRTGVLDTSAQRDRTSDKLTEVSRHDPDGEVDSSAVVLGVRQDNCRLCDVPESETDSVWKRRGGHDQYKSSTTKGRMKLTDSSTEDEVPLDAVPRVDVVRRAVDREGHGSEDESPSNAQGRDDGTSKERDECDGGLRRCKGQRQRAGG